MKKAARSSMPPSISLAMVQLRLPNSALSGDEQHSALRRNHGLEPRDVAGRSNLLPAPGRALSRTNHDEPGTAGHEATVGKTAKAVNVGTAVDPRLSPDLTILRSLDYAAL